MSRLVLPMGWVGGSGGLCQNGGGSFGKRSVTVQRALKQEYDERTPCVKSKEALSTPIISPDERAGDGLRSWFLGLILGRGR